MPKCKTKIHYIYKIYFLCGSPSGRYYIGKRTYDGKDILKDKYHGSGKFCKAYFAKYGAIYGKTYIKEIIEVNISKEINKEREEIIIGDLWKTDPLCMNQKRGGEGKGWEKGHDLSKEAREKISNKLSNPIDQYDLDGNLIKHWKSVAEASRYFNCTVATISGCCARKYTTSNGYIWRWAYDKIFDSDLYTINKHKIVAFNLDGTFCKIYNSSKEAAIDNNLAQNTIINCCNKKRERAGNYMFRFYLEVKDQMSIKPYDKYQERAINQYDKDWNYINTFTSISLASLAIKGDRKGSANIQACCKGNKASAYGFKWKYVEED